MKNVQALFFDPMSNATAQRLDFGPGAAPGFPTEV
jgi:hypothetical protein